MPILISPKDGLDSVIPFTNVRFRPETELGIFVQNLVEKSLMMISTSLDENTVDVLKENIVHMMESEQGAQITDQLDKLTILIAKKISDAFEELKNGICPEVETLQQDIVKLAHEYISTTSGINALTESLNSASNLFRFIDWRIVEVAGSVNDIIGILHKKCNLSGEASVLNMNYIIRKFAGVETIAIPEEGRANIIGLLENKMSSDISVETVNLVLNLLTSSDACNSYINNRFPSNEVSTLSASCVVNAYTILTDIYPFIVNLKEINPSLIDADKIKWDNNLDNLMYLMYAMIYLLQVARVKKMSDVLILDSETLNKDQFEVYQSKGGTTVDIGNFIRTYYNQNPNDIMNMVKAVIKIPPTGVRTDDVLNAKAKVNEMISRAEVSLKGSLLVIKDTAFRNAYAFILKNYIKEYINSLENVGDKQNLEIAMFSQVAATQHLISKKDESVESAIYEFFFRTKYKNTTAEVVFRKLGMEYVKMVSDHGNITDEDMNLADALVMADIAAEFLMSMMEVTA